MTSCSRGGASSGREQGTATSTPTRPRVDLSPLPRLAIFGQSWDVTSSFGAGIFEFCDGSPVLDGYLWPLIAVGQNRTIHMACVDDATRDNHWYTRAATWCNWDVPVLVTPIAPTFPSHNVSASKVSDKVCQMWIKCDRFPYSAYFRRSSDGGTTWGSIVDLGYPPAFGSDTACSYYITSSMPFYDRQDRLHIVVDVIPVINDNSLHSTG